jgi:thioredoxin-related protein
MIKKIVLPALLSLFCCVAIAEPIKLAENLAQDANLARDAEKPIIFFVTADHCPYCEQLREEYFQFSTSDDRFILRELELDEFHDVIDFSGSKSNHQLLADRYNISLTPTVAFVGPDGEELTDAIIGVLTMDFYNHYFEKALDESISQLKGRKLAKQP